MLDLQSLQKKQEAAGDTISADGFVGESRNGSEDVVILAKGDKIVFPAQYQVKKAKRFNDAQYINVSVERDGVVGAMPLFPSTFVKSVAIWKKDPKGKLVPVKADGGSEQLRLGNSGKPCDDFRAVVGGLAEQMDIFKGKTIAVTKVDNSHQTLRYGTDNQLKGVVLYEFEWVS